MGPAELAWTLYSTQSRDQAGSPMSPVFQVAGRSDEAIVRVAYLLTQVTDPQAPALVDALRSDDEQLRRFAVAWRQALQGG
jgi:tetrahydromethanopterin S-methyltransferase subunit H